jgi:hypothetical protein
MERHDKGYRGDASQFFIAGELCRRGLVAVITMGNCPNTDILCSNPQGTKFVHIQVKTFIPGSRTCSVGMKAEKYYGDNFFWVLGGIPEPNAKREFEYYIIPSKVMAENIKESHHLWEITPGMKGQKHNFSKVRTVLLPPRVNGNKWSITEYLNRWDILEDKLCSK